MMYLLTANQKLRFQYPEMPLFRKFPEIRKFEIERKNFRKNETVSLDKNNWSKRGKRFGKKENVSKLPYQTPKWQLFHTLVFSQVFRCSYYQRVNAATVKFRKFGIVPVASLVPCISYCNLLSMDNACSKKEPKGPRPSCFASWCT